MERALTPNRRVAACGRDLVFLDLIEGAYDLMAGAAIFAKPSPCGRRLIIDDGELDAALAKAGWLDNANERPSGEPLPDLPSRSVLTDPSATWSTLDWGRMLGAWAVMSRRFWRRSLLDMTMDVRRAGADLPPVRPDSVRRLARGVHQHLPWLPIQGDCLFRCALLLRTLSPRDRAGVQWVFGVKTWPFHAHCWLQCDDLALTDPHEPLVGFSPILVA